MYTIILAGGFGTRMFPLSRSSYPKQFIPLFGDQSLFQKAVLRGLLFSKSDEIYIVTNKDHKFIVEDQLQQINVSCNVILEPCGKNTLPAIMNASVKINSHDAYAKILVLSSDQLIENSSEYKNAVSSALNMIDKYIVTFGIIPNSPHTGYGYIQKGKSLEDGYEVSAFKEKPDLETAKKYLAEGYLWNAGMFCFSSYVFLNECRKTAQNVVDAFSNPDDTAYLLTPKISIDYGLLEKTDSAAVVPMPIEWNDLGSFEALYSIHDKDENENAVDGEYITPDGKNNLVISDKLVTTIGLSGVAIIDTPDVLMICPKNQTQKIGLITDMLNEKRDERVMLHTTVHRPWGTFRTIMKGDTFHVKRLVISPHKRISLQYHNHRSEHWVVVKGVAEVTNGCNVSIIHAGESTFIPVGVAHRLANFSDDLLEVIEVQNGELLSESDIVRIVDDYNRL